MQGELPPKNDSDPGGKVMNAKKGTCKIILYVILVSILHISLAHAFETSQLQWAQGTTAKLQLGEVFTYKGYSVEAVMFPQPVESDRYREIPAEPVDAYVGLNILKNGRFIDTVVLGLEDSYILPDGELKISAKKLPSKTATEWLFESYSQWAVIELSPRGTPNLEMLIETDKDNYIASSDTEIAATMQLENTGSADAINVDVSIDTQLEIKNGKSKYHYDRIKKGELVTETIIFSLPLDLKQMEYRIMVNASGYDAKEMVYTGESQKIIAISAGPNRGLSIRKSVNNRIYLKDYAMISLSLKNNGKDDLKNVRITDSLPKGFKLLGNRTLNWVADIPAGGDWDFRYLVKPLEVYKDGIALPAATAEFKINKELYMIRSNQPKITVYGPRIVLSKYANISWIEPDETGAVLTVTVAAENTGKTPTKVIIKDRLPENATIISGNTTYEGFLQANRKVSFNYSMKIDSTMPIILPPAVADYFELGAMGEKISTASTGPVIEANVTAATGANASQVNNT